MSGISNSLFNQWKYSLILYVCSEFFVKFVTICTFFLLLRLLNLHIIIFFSFVDLLHWSFIDLHSFEHICINPDNIRGFVKNPSDRHRYWSKFAMLLAKLGITLDVISCRYYLSYHHLFELLLAGHYIKEKFRLHEFTPRKSSLSTLIAFEMRNIKYWSA